MIKIQECNERLVAVKRYCPSLVVHLGRKRAGEQAFLRLTVARMLKKALASLPRGMTFIINDAWRPAVVQERIRQEFFFRFKEKNPNWSTARIRKEVDKYVAPSQGGKVSGHMTGGAVDLRLLSNGRKVPMKSSKLSYQENAQSNQPKLSKYLQRNRAIMFQALQNAGLSNYPQEYWHWSYGDYYWARRNKKKIAIFGRKSGPKTLY